MTREKATKIVTDFLNDMNANLEDSSIDTYLDGILIRKSAYPSIADLVKEELSSLSFDSLIEYSDQEIEEYKRIRNGIPISTLNKYYCDHFLTTYIVGNILISMVESWILCLQIEKSIMSIKFSIQAKKA